MRNAICRYVLTVLLPFQLTVFKYYLLEDTFAVTLFFLRFFFVIFSLNSAHDNQDALSQSNHEIWITQFITAKKERYFICAPRKVQIDLYIVAALDGVRSSWKNLAFVLSFTCILMNESPVFIQWHQLYVFITNTSLRMTVAYEFGNAAIITCLSFSLRVAF